MQVGLIGAGRVAQAFARHLIATGHEVLLSNSKGPESLHEVVARLGSKARAVTSFEAASAEMVMLGVPWLKLAEALHGLPAWGNRILIDATNQFVTATELADLHGRVSSEIVSALAPGARVVKALNNLFVERFDDGPGVAGGQRITFVSGNDADANEQVGTLLRGFGFAVINLGSLHVGGLMQQAGGPLAGLDLVKFA
jgi:predicted dinucleotide-binding enzyme